MFVRERRKFRLRRLCLKKRFFAEGGSDASQILSFARAGPGLRPGGVLRHHASGLATSAEPVVADRRYAADLRGLRDIPQGDLLNADVAKIEPWPKDKVPQGGIGRIEDLEGRRTRAKLYAGEPILENKLFPKGTAQGSVSSVIPKGYRVVSIRVDAVSGGANLVLPGDRVDLLVHMARNDGNGIHETTTRTVLQDIKVFAVNDVVNLDSGGPETKSIQPEPFHFW